MKITSYQQRKKEIRELKKVVSELEDRLKENGIEFGQLSIGQNPHIIFDYNELMCLYSELREIIPNKRDNTVKLLWVNMLRKIERRIIDIDKRIHMKYDDSLFGSSYPKYKTPSTPPLPIIKIRKRVINENVGVFCPICHSSMSRRGYLGLFGQRKCDNKECKNSK